MDGYDATTYGRGFADVYDDWYADITDVAATVRAVVALAPGGDVLELGVGTGRLAVPLADAGLCVTGIDSSPDMLARLAERDGDRRVRVVCGDMVDDLPDAHFDVVLVAYNTLFNVLDPAAQHRCFAEVARRLRPGGHFVVETIVTGVGPSADRTAVGRSDDVIAVRSMTADRVVLSITQSRDDEQTASGQFVELTERFGVRLRPWSIRWATLDQLDSMASAAGLVLEARWRDMDGSDFVEGDDHQVSVYRRPEVVNGR